MYVCTCTNRHERVQKIKRSKKNDCQLVSSVSDGKLQSIRYDISKGDSRLIEIRMLPKGIAYNTVPVQDDHDANVQNVNTTVVECRPKTEYQFLVRID